MGGRSKRRQSGGSGKSQHQQQPEDLPCSHIEKSITVSKVRTALPHAPFRKCCSCNTVERISVCFKCGRQYCPSHRTDHTRTNNHSVLMDLEQETVTCYTCNKDVTNSKASAIQGAVAIVSEFVKKHAEKRQQADCKQQAKAGPEKVSDIKDTMANGTVANASPAIEPSVFGLRNTGVICFFNSVLQNLIQTPMLRASLECCTAEQNIVVESKKFGSMPLQLPADKHTMAQKILSFLELHDTKDRAKAPYAHEIFQEMSKFNECLSDGQQDAQEAFHSILQSITTEEARKRKEAICTELNVTKSNLKSLSDDKRQKLDAFLRISLQGIFVEQLFGGTILHQITCLECGAVTKTIDPFLDLSLPMAKRVQATGYRKERAKEENGLSKHQKKKQQKESRKGKRDRRDSSQKGSTAAAKEGERIEVSSSTPDESNMAVEEEAPSPDQCDIVAVEELELEIVKVGEEVEDMGMITLEDIHLEPPELAPPLVEEGDVLSEKLSDLTITEPTLKGGLRPCEEEEEDEGMLCGLFAVEEAEEAEEEVREYPAREEGEEDEAAELCTLDTGDLGEDTLEGCLAQYCAEQLLSGDNQFSCEACGRDRPPDIRSGSGSGSGDEEEEEEEEEGKGKVKPVLVDAQTQTRLHTLPPILTIHLKRFTQTNRGHYTKDRRRITYPLELSLDKFAVRPTGHRYRLYGVVDHSGSLNHGHYIAYVRKRDTSLDSCFSETVPLGERIKLLGQINSERRQNGSGGGGGVSSGSDQWFCCNDERVSSVNVKKVLGADAYLLFYERISPVS